MSCIVSCNQLRSISKSQSTSRLRSLYLDDLVRFAAGGDVVSSFAAVALPFLSAVFFSAAVAVVDASRVLFARVDLVGASGS